MIQTVDQWTVEQQNILMMLYITHYVAKDTQFNAVIIRSTLLGRLLIRCWSKDLCLCTTYESVSEIGHWYARKSPVPLHPKGSELCTGHSSSSTAALAFRPGPHGACSLCTGTLSYWSKVWVSLDPVKRSYISTVCILFSRVLATLWKTHMMVWWSGVHKYLVMWWTGG